MTPKRPRQVYVLPAIADDFDDAQKNALAVRNAATVQGLCPDCGARGELKVDNHDILHLVFRHDSDCAALTRVEA